MDNSEPSAWPWWLTVLIGLLGGACLWFAATHPAPPSPPCRGHRIHMTDGVRQYDGCVEPSAYRARDATP